jgi:hypothetical protein
MLSGIIEQGRSRGRDVSPSSPDGAARAIVSLILGAQDMAVELFFARQAGEISVEVVVSTMAGWHRGLRPGCWGLPPGSMSLIDENTLRLWFGSGAEMAGVTVLITGRSRAGMARGGS